MLVYHLYERYLLPGILIWITTLLPSCHRLTQKDGGIVPANALFEAMPASYTGITFQNILRPDTAFNILEYDYYYNGGGVAAADFNGDGLTDLYFTGNQVSGKLYLNKGAFTFEDVTAPSGVGTKNWATGVAVADVNGDGLPDIYICYAGYQNPVLRTHELFINKGNDKAGIPHFREEAALYGLDDTSYSTQAVFFDYDRDGDLDLFLLNHQRSKLNPNYPGKRMNDGSIPGISKLYRNDSQNGNCHFTDVSKQAGITYEGYGLGAAIGDINQDGWPDIYVANDFIFNDLLYMNNKDGTFTESLQSLVGHTSRFAMGCDIADFNNDGFLDIAEVDMLPDSNRRQKEMSASVNNYSFEYALHAGYQPQYSRNMLQLNNGPDGQEQYSFSEIGQLAGISRTDWSWSVLFADLDNDGWKDLFITNGIPKDITNNDFTAYRDEAIRKNPDPRSWKTDLLGKLENLAPVAKSNFIFRNSHNLLFADSSSAWGMSGMGFSNGAVYADLDNDGDLDLVTNNINAYPSVYRNRGNEINRNHFLRIKLRGPYSSGARLTLWCRGKQQYIENYTSRGFQSTQENIVHFGMGPDSVADILDVTWADGKKQELRNVKANQVLILDHHDALPALSRVPADRPLIKRPFFTAITEKTGLKFVHKENPFEDFNVEPLLPHRFSRNGPFMAVADADANGLQDIWIGGPAGIPGKLFLQQPDGAFTSKDMPDAGFEDMGGLFFDADGDGDPDLYVVSGGNEYNAFSAPYQDRLYINDGRGNFTWDHNALPAETASGSCVITADFDKDGDPDLFVGGRVVPGKYPMAAASYLLRNDGRGKFEDVTDAICPGLKNIGMVTCALWTDFDNDGWMDLIVAGEWMPVTFFKNKKGKLEKLEFPETFTDSTRGWWFSIAAGDFDQDGDTDYVLGNLGLNNNMQPSIPEPVTVYSKDFMSNGRPEPILTYFENHSERTLAGRDQIAQVLPAIRKRFDTYGKFADAPFSRIFPAEDLSGALTLRANTFASSYLENKGHGKFEVHELPLPAQFSTIQAMQVHDFDGDGNLDILAGGNFFSPEIMTGRYDASIGLFLRGDGHGHFKAVPARESGIHFRGDVRSLAPLTWRGKPAVLVGANSGGLLVYCY